MEPTQSSTARCKVSLDLASLASQITTPSLYSPTAPFNSRFTILANTTINRLYYSEAILLQDSRILVSGSDPGGRS